MPAIDAVTVAFAGVNLVRLCAYVPQILAILRDPADARAVSTLSWGIFAGSNLATALYAHAHAGDVWLAAFFALNAASATVILGLTARKRRSWRTIRAEQDDYRL